MYRVPIRLNNLIVICFILLSSAFISSNSVLGGSEEIINHIETIEIASNFDFHNRAIEYGWSGDGSSAKPYLIADMEFRSSSYTTSIQISNTDVYFEIFRNNFLGGTTYHSAIFLSDVQNGVIDTNYIEKFYDGIKIVNSANLVISNNTITNNLRMGIDILDSNDLFIEYNNITKIGYHAIQVSNSNNVEIIENNISNIVSKGIHLTLEHDFDTFNLGINVLSNDIQYVGFNGISMTHTNRSTVFDNVVGYTDNGMGIVVGSAFGNDIHENIVYGTSSYGLSIEAGSTQEGAGDNYVYNNIFVNNGYPGRSQGSTGGINNTIEYNYWNDWTSPDVDNDSIVDEPYPLARFIEAEPQFDNYPRILTGVCDMIENRDICIKKEFTINYTIFTPATTRTTSTEESTGSSQLAVDSSLVLIGLVMVPILRIGRRKSN